MHTHHAFDYVEMSSPDLEGQRDFYAAAFGMSFTAYGPDYLGMSMGDREIGGLERGAFRGAGGPLVVLYSEDIDATLASIEGAGGRITQPITPFPGGRRLHFVDPAGYELAVWSAPASD